MRPIILILIWSVFILNGCQNVPQTPQHLSVEQVLKENIEEWNVSINPRKEKNKWVYDTQLEYLGIRQLMLL
ncbi:hypothetical protein V7266_17120 [Neobacillus drentensis]|uniref:hypothetical protein n=1 Tax=Neobacillus drentensis TaxID=220684 RepID=UPI002FFD8415